MTRHFSNQKSVQEQLEELKKVQDRAKVLIDEMKAYMDENDIDRLNGITLCYDRVWSSDTLIFNSKQFAKDNPNLYEQYKTQEKAGSYRYQVKAVK